MTVPDQVPFTEQVANGATVKFFVQFQYADKAYLHIYVDGVEPSVSEVYFDDNAFNFYTAPEEGKVIKIQRITPKERDTDYDQSDNTFRPRVVSADFDKIWYVLQEVFADIGGLSQAVQDEIIARIQGDDDILNQLSVEISARILGDEAVTDNLKDYVNQVVGAILNDPTFDGIDADKVNVNGGGTQQQINDRGGATWYAKSGGYALNDRVILANGDIVRSIIPNNTNDPNIISTGWAKPNTETFVSPEFFVGADSSKLQQALNTGASIIVSKPYTINTQLEMTTENTRLLFTKTGKITTTVNQNVLNVRANKCKILEANIQGFGTSSVHLAIGTGITLHGTYGCEISYSKINGAGGCPILLTPAVIGGIHYSCEENVIAYNDIDCESTNLKSFDSAGIMLGYTNEVSNTYMHKNNHIYSNEVNGRDVVHHGIAMIGRGNGNKFDQNVIFDCREYGNVIYQSPYIDGTLFDNASVGNIITNIGHKDDNLCTKGMGIYLQKSDTTVVRDNIIRHVLLGTNNDTNLSRAGIAIGACVGSIVDGNIIEDSKQFGIQFAESFGCKAVNNYVDGCLKDLVRITSSSSIDVKDNTLINGGAYGVYASFFTRTTGRADHNGRSGDNINISSNTIKSVLSPVWLDSIDTSNNVIDSSILNNATDSPAISIYIKNALDTLISSNRCKSSSNLARIQVDTSDRLTVCVNDIYSSDAAQAGRIVLTNATNHNVAGNTYSPANSNTPLNINGVAFRADRKRYFNTTFPTSGTYDAGDVVWNSVPVAGQPLGWVCVDAAGSGVWATFGTIGGFATLTTTSLQAIGNTINTVGKFAGKQVFNTTNSKMYYAEGAAAASRWMQFDSGGAITPV